MEVDVIEIWNCKVLDSSNRVVNEQLQSRVPQTVTLIWQDNLWKINSVIFL